MAQPDVTVLLEKASKDIRAVVALAVQDPTLTGIMAMHIQQFIEKVIKVRILVGEIIRFHTRSPRTSGIHR